jgi:hypothetical protein
MTRPTAHHSRPRPSPCVLAAVLLGSWIPVLVPGGGLRAQDPDVRRVVIGVVVEQLTTAPVGGAVVTAFRVAAPRARGADGAEDPALTPVATTRSDEDGYFEMEFPGPGDYRLEARFGGLTSPLSDRLHVGAEGTVTELVLVLPSPLLSLAYTCKELAGEGFATVVGLARDPEVGVVLPEVRVEVRWQEGEFTRTRAGSSDRSGRYQVCGVPPDARFVQIQGQLLGRMSAIEEVEFSGPALVLHDVELRMSAGTQERAAPGSGVIQERILAEAAAHGLGDLGGELVDAFTGEPIRQAVVHVVGLPLQTVSDGNGRFRLEDVRPGSWVLEVRHLGYDVNSDPIEVPGGRDVFVRMRVEPQAIALSGIEVTARSAVQELARITPFRRDIVYGEAMAIEENRGARAHEILRRASPGIRVVERHREIGPPVVCIEMNRSVQRFLNTESSLPSVSIAPACDGMVQLILDGTRIPPDETSDLLRTLPAADIESIEVLNPVEAATLYGTGGNVANGVVVIHTRGRGPYASPLRNRGPGH